MWMLMLMLNGVMEGGSDWGMGMSKGGDGVYIMARVRTGYNRPRKYGVCSNNKNFELFGQCRRLFVATRDLGNL